MISSHFLDSDYRVEIFEQALLLRQEIYKDRKLPMLRIFLHSTKGVEILSLLFIGPPAIKCCYTVEDFENRCEFSVEIISITSVADLA